VEKVGGVSAGAEKTRWGLGSGRKCEWRWREEEGGRHCGRVGSLVAFQSCWKVEAPFGGHCVSFASDPQQTK